MGLSVIRWVVVILFGASEMTMAFLKRANRKEAEVKDRGSMPLLWIVIVLSLMLAIGSEWVTVARMHITALLYYALTIGLTIVGLTIRWYSIITLGRLFTVDVAIQRNHELIERGPYKYVRHPSYTGLLIAFVGLGVFFANWLSILFLVVPITFAILNRIVKEEKALREALGPSYSAYCARTKRLIPGLW
ncbi:MAG: isoprenylcysteine carboxylmethyltransferase family protein [Candidatus Eisenbacteria bacterium]|nr:isoprenylcysteine carboxylmethyltransferase family protein [Candidatus Eisenbacteria bacterium]